MLSPHEAILNRNAAELMGRDKIAVLNAKGNKLAQRGIDLPSYQSGTSDVGSERAALLQEAEDAFYGGGQAQKPKPTPTPTPKPRKYQYGTSNVRRAVDMAQPAQFSPARGITFGGGFPSGGSPTGASPAFGSQNTNVTASSFGTSPLGAGVPDLSYADPRTLGRLDISNLIYSSSAGGYLTRADAENANSYYNKFGAGGGGDPTANQRAASYYGYIGSLPTRPIGTPALNQLYSFGGTRPAPGPSYNTTLGNLFGSASPFMQSQFRAAGFGPTYTGPFEFGRRDPNYNEFGAYKGFGNG